MSATTWVLLFAALAVVTLLHLPVYAYWKYRRWFTYAERRRYSLNAAATVWVSLPMSCAAVIILWWIWKVDR